MFIIVLLLVISSLLVSVNASVEVKSYVEYSEIWDNSHKGRICWFIDGNDAQILKKALAKNYDFNQDGIMEMEEVASYFRVLVSLLNGQQVGTVIASTAAPLHGWKNGDIDYSDVQGLLGSLETGFSINISVKFSGKAVSDGNTNGHNLSLIPFAAATRSSIANCTIHLDAREEHTEIGATFYGYGVKSAQVVMRLGLGSFYYRSGAAKNCPVTKQNGSIIDSPMFLLVSLLVAVKIGDYFAGKSLYTSPGKCFSRNNQRKIRKVLLSLKTIFAVLYLFPRFYFFHLSSFLFLILVVTYPFLVFLILKYFVCDSCRKPHYDGKILGILILDRNGSLIFSKSCSSYNNGELDDMFSHISSIRESAGVDYDVILKIGDKKVVARYAKDITVLIILEGELREHVTEKIENFLGKTVDECKRQTKSKVDYYSTCVRSLAESICE